MQARAVGIREKGSCQFARRARGVCPKTPASAASAGPIWWRPRQAQPRRRTSRKTLPARGSVAAAVQRTNLTISTALRVARSALGLQRTLQSSRRNQPPTRPSCPCRREPPRARSAHHADWNWNPTLHSVPRVERRVLRPRHCRYRRTPERRWTTRLTPRYQPSRAVPFLGVASLCSPLL